MKIVILAGGKGTRLRPLTSDKPKCMVKYKNKPILEYILEAIKGCGLPDIAIVGGYKHKVLEDYLKNEKISFFINKHYSTTNMVSTLFCAKEFMDDDLIISYSDIVYDEKILQKLIDSKDDFSVVVDKRWRELWLQRMDNPLDDAETLKLKDGKIIELGKKPKSYDEIQGQYIGLIKISKNVLNKVINFYETLDRKAMYDGKNFNNMYMTSFIQMIIDDLLDVKPVFIDGGWIEVDDIDDLKVIME